MDQLQVYLVDYSLWALFIGTVLEGDIILVLAGFLAHVGLFPYWQKVGNPLLPHRVGTPVGCLSAPTDVVEVRHSSRRVAL